MKQSYLAQIRSIVFFSVLAGSAFAVADAADAPIQLEVATDKVLAPVNPDVISSFNFGNWMQIAEFKDELGKVNPHMFRFPGGNVGDEYDMNEDIMKVLKSNLELINNPALLFHTRVFHEKSGEKPARNGPADAAASVRLARKLGIKVSYWEVGNEPDLFAVTRGDPSWTAARYCEVFRAQAKAIKEADPEAIVAGPAVSGAAPARDQFLESFVKGCGDVVDVLTYHIYPTDGRMADANALNTASDGDEIIARYRALWSDPKRNPLGHKRDIRYGVTEFGLSWRSDDTRHLADFPGAMWATEIALRLNQNGVAIANYFAFQATGGHGLLDNSGVPRPTYYAFQILRDLKGKLLAARSADDDLWVHAALDGKALTVLVINKGKMPKAVSTALPGARFVGGDYFDEKIVEEEGPLGGIDAKNASAALPGYSIARLNYTLD